MDSTKKPTPKTRRSRKKVDSCYSPRTGKDDVKHPQIRIGGIYLQHFGFNIGDEVDIVCEQGEIWIRKVATDRTVVKSKKTRV